MFKLNATRIVAGFAVLASAVCLAMAQTPPAPPVPSAEPAPATLVKTDDSKVLTTADILAAAKAGRADKTDLMVSTNLVAQPPYRLNVEHRIAGTTPPSIHEKNGELFVVIDGDGVLITGGRLVNPVRRNATNIAGTAIADGNRHPLHKGDIMFVPAGTPHQLADVKNTLTMVITMLPAGTTP
jgi:mannose-6-phosphate isomerase-like protein (cupin superfamily)